MSIGHFPRTHGESRGASQTPECRAWAAMIARCESPSAGNYALYGGRGITVCERWRHSLVNFIADIGRRPSPKHTVDRIDNDGNYEPGNVRWATAVEQGRNRRTNRNLTLRGETKTITEWAAEAGLPVCTIHQRLIRGWDTERAVFGAVDVTRRRKA